MSKPPKPFVANELDSSQRTSARLHCVAGVKDESVRVSTEVECQWKGITLGPQDFLRLIHWLTAWVTHVTKDRSA